MYFSMPRLKIKNTEQAKLARFELIKNAITALEKQRLFFKEGELAPSGAWGSTLSSTAEQQKILCKLTTEYMIIMLILFFLSPLS